MVVGEIKKVDQRKLNQFVDGERRIQTTTISPSALKKQGLSRPTVRKWWDPDKVVVSAAAKPQAKKAEEPEKKLCFSGCD